MTRLGLYAAFCVVATLVNLGAQRVVLSFGDQLFVGAVLVGTAAGLVVKYALDRHWIFGNQPGSAGQFSLYTAMGVATTALFWATETAFWLLWQTDAMREVGAALGLSIGYITKYLLDRRYVFTT